MVVTLVPGNIALAGSGIIDDDDIGGYTSVVLSAAGNPIIAYLDNANEDLLLAFCDDAITCSNPTITMVDGTGARVGAYTSMVLDSSGNPIIAYQDIGDGDLKIAFCNNNTDCDSPILTTIDDVGAVGWHTSIVLDGSGNPIISYYDVTNGNLKIAFCNNNTNCNSPTLTTVDDGGGDDVGLYTSLVLDGSGNPIISYYDATNDDLLLAFCNNATNCDAPVLTPVDTTDDVGSHNSLVLDSSGNPIIAYLDITAPRNLGLAFCNNATNCDAPTLTYVPGWPVNTSTQLDSSGNPVIGFIDVLNGMDLTIARCNDSVDCDSPSLVVPDGPTLTGRDTSLVLDANDNPIVSYFNYEGGVNDLKLYLPPSLLTNDTLRIDPGDTAAITGAYLDSTGDTFADATPTSVTASPSTTAPVTPSTTAPVVPTDTIPGAPTITAPVTPTVVTFGTQFRVTSGTTNGTLSLTTFTLADIAAGNLTYTNTNRSASRDSFEFVIEDGTSTIGPFTFNIVIRQPRDDDRGASDPHGRDSA
jgi:hypothetical protein